MTNAYDVFVSYSRRDQPFVRKLVDRLLQSGVSVFYDEADIAVGQSLADSLNRAVQNAKYVLVVMSPDYFASQWGKLELALALQQEFESDRTKVIPLLLRDCEIPPLLRSKLYADFRDTEVFEHTFSKVLAAILEVPISSVRPAKGEEIRPPALGSIDPVAAKSTELREMVNDLRVKVEAFMEGSQHRTEPEKVPEPVVDPKLCFIIMPFGPEELTDVYEYFVKPSIETNCDLRCERGDDVFGSNVIMDDIRRSIERARLVVADLTGRNPNVFYEVGIAHTLNKEVLLLSQSMSDVPFDLRHRRVLVYDYTPKGCKKLERNVTDNVNAILREGA
ncbi:toll/interleukin-1 receptor domain-containing protein [Candidatus Bipolaricaulota bacterium]|nr:toll/interleukin-1 receptor domain-containing protein [Candidatus Bipolaricaulota bacterium]